MIRIRHLLGAKPRPALPALLGSVLLLSGLAIAAAAPFREGAQSPAILVPSALLKQVDAAAKAEGIDPDLMRAMIQCESRFDPLARSPIGALGLMQLMPQTAARFGAKDPLMVDQNLKAGASYLRFLLDHYNGDTARAVTAYNAGEQAVDRSSGIAPTEESRLYALAVMDLYREKGVQATEASEGVQIIQGSLEPVGNGTFHLTFSGWLMGSFDANVVQTGDSAKSVAHFATRGNLSTARISPKIAFQPDPGKGPLKITFKDFGSHRQGEALVPLDARAFTVTLGR